MRNIGSTGALHWLWRGEVALRLRRRRRVEARRAAVWHTGETFAYHTRMSTDLHTQLIDLAAKWLAVKQAVVITDMSHGLGRDGGCHQVDLRVFHAGGVQSQPRGISLGTSTTWRRDPSRVGGQSSLLRHACRADFDPAEVPGELGLLNCTGKLKAIVKAHHQKRGASAETSLAGVRPATRNPQYAPGGRGGPPLPSNPPGTRDAGVQPLDFSA